LHGGFEFGTWIRSQPTPTTDHDGRTDSRPAFRIAVNRGKAPPHLIAELPLRKFSAVAVRVAEERVIRVQFRRRDELTFGRLVPLSKNLSGRVRSDAVILTGLPTRRRLRELPPVRT